MVEAIPGENYEHRKGGHYVVLELAEHTETRKPMVVYRRISDGRVFVRPRELFEDGRFTRKTPECALRPWRGAVPCRLCDGEFFCTWLGVPLLVVRLPTMDDARWTDFRARLTSLLQSAPLSSLKVP